MPHIYIMRHGQSGPAPPALPDSSRTLTQRGFSEVRTVAARLSRRAPDIELVYFSPYVRARQTAALVNQALNAEMSLLEELHPGGDPDRIIDVLAGVEGEVLLVSHMPLVAELTHRLTGAKSPFHEGTCVKVAREDAYARNGTLAWTLTH